VTGGALQPAPMATTVALCCASQLREPARPATLEAWTVDPCAGRDCREVMVLRFSLTLLLAFLSFSPFAEGRGNSHAAIVVAPIFAPWYYNPFYYNPFYYDPFYYDPFYYRRPLLPPPRRPMPPADVESMPAPTLPSTEPTYWYCFNTKQYYPETTQCPGGWQQVVPRYPPPPPPPSPSEPRRSESAQ
jgi:hypothetical protein